MNLDSKYYLPTLLIVIMVLMWSCAAEGRAQGGPVDETGPVVLAVEPDTDFLAGELRVIVRFDEMVNPLSVPASITIFPEVDHIVRTRGKTIQIIPEQKWPEEAIIHIQLSRRIRDYQGNDMAEPLELFYSTGGIIPGGKISGHLFNTTAKTIYNIGLFSFENGRVMDKIRKTDSTVGGYFEFLHVPDGLYVIAVIEGELNEFSEDFRRRKYGMQSYAPLSIESGNEILDIPVYIDEPVERLEIKSVDFINSIFYELVFNDGSTSLYFVRDDGLREFTETSSDTLAISLDLSNRLEEYRCDEFIITQPVILDTIPPELNKYAWDNEEYLLTFSEPVQPIIGDVILDSLFLTVNDSLITGILNYNFKSPYVIQLNQIPVQDDKLQIQFFQLQDYFSNVFTDSVKKFNVMPQLVTETEFELGSIVGSVNYTGSDSIIVEANSIESGEKYYSTSAGEFVFEDLPAGDYVFRAFEKKNLLNPNIYFSGLWNPYRKAARFGIYPDTIEVRKRWVIEGVQIDIY
ncbi:MAG: hypothetical protein HN729_04000 [Candidatus Marinimicrobia bacterium]|nr:hypothetical protein [Candidatus Neomarinimicrobiota bacterium]